MTTLPSSELNQSGTDLDESSEAQALHQAMDNLRNELAAEQSHAEVGNFKWGSGPHGVVVALDIE